MLARRPVIVDVPDGGITDTTSAATVHCELGRDDPFTHVVDANERGLKDTVCVNPHEIVDLAVRFETHSGRYMYHRHILEHDDRDMMRPIAIMPAALMPLA